MLLPNTKSNKKYTLLKNLQEYDSWEWPFLKKQKHDQAHHKASENVNQNYL